ncbi:hypothetical protein [Streptomyces aurantiogriseus]|uniref:Uncharacterized protein n=1 Tax=Streptomyces aurantiogriseus TaxID=66870 RepID=A0A918CHY3_9ACTN|nr:hypothetical protein [Streptomyces aurantiogriseus]GGR26174.1 hypothetical protein GCM10010251_47940 [Streptomyces aurantiogriseus]
MYDPFDLPRPREVQAGEYPVWDEALALVNRDLAALLPDHGPLRLLALPPWDDLDESEREHVYVALPDGRWHGSDLWHGSEATLTSALAAVAEAAQDTVMECLWQVWPVCAEHRIGMHTRQEDGRPVWWCAGGRGPGDPAHVRAAVGELDALHRPRRARRKRR